MCQEQLSWTGRGESLTGVDTKERVGKGLETMNTDSYSNRLLLKGSRNGVIATEGCGAKNCFSHSVFVCS